MKIFWFILIVIIFSINCLGSVYKIFSDNCEFRAEIIVYSLNYKALFGQTKIYDNKSNSFIYKINRGFLDNFYLSNTGSGILYISTISDTIYHYKNGNLNRTYWIDELLNCDKRFDYCTLFYSNFEIRLPYDSSQHNRFDFLRKYYLWELDTAKISLRLYRYKPNTDSILIIADRFPIFSYNDSVYIITPKLQLFKFSIETGDLLIDDYLKNAKDLIHKLNYQYHETEDFDDKYKEFPELKNGTSLINLLSSEFSYHFCDINEMYKNDSLKYYRFWVEGLLSSENKFKVINIKGDSIAFKQDLIKFFEMQEFDDFKFPEFIDNWYYRDNFYFRNYDLKKARIESLYYDSIANEIRKINELKDSINGVYIPKDMNECMNSLDSILTPLEIKHIENFESIDNFIYYNNDFNHFFGYGAMIKDKWGLFNGSRLSLFFNKMGIFDIDSMSTYILESYYCHRKGIKYNLEEQIKIKEEKYKKQHEEWEKQK